MENVINESENIMQDEINKTEQNGQIEEYTEEITELQSANIESQKSEQLNLGKFKDVNSLLNAYNNLQAEFTKKCQKLSEISKKSCDNADFDAPQQKQQWAERFNSFLAANQDAREYSKEISELLISNTELLNSENALEKAWTKVLMNNLSNLKQQMQNNNFLTQLVKNNADIKDNIIKDYIESIKEKHSPELINARNGSFTISKHNSVSDLEEAAKLVRAMFK